MSLDPQQVLDNAARRLIDIVDYDDRLIGLIDTYATIMNIPTGVAVKDLYRRLNEMTKPEPKA